MMYHFLRRVVMGEKIIGGKWRGHNSLLVIIHVNFSLCIKDAQLILILFISINLYSSGGKSALKMQFVCCMINEYIYI